MRGCECKRIDGLRRFAKVEALLFRFVFVEVSRIPRGPLLPRFRILPAILGVKDHASCYPFLVLAFLHDTS